MQKSNVFHFPKCKKKQTFLLKRQKERIKERDYNTIDRAFVEKSTLEFKNSILLGNLYQELQSKVPKNGSKVVLF